MNNTYWLWIWYFVALIVAWIIIYWAGRRKISGAMAFFAAALFALVVGLILLPYFYHPLLTGGEKASLTAFIVVAILLPFVGLIVWAILRKGKEAIAKRKLAKETGIKNKDSIIVENPCTGEQQKVADKYTCTDGRHVTKVYNPSIKLDDGYGYDAGDHYSHGYASPY